MPSPDTPFFPKEKNLHHSFLIRQHVLDHQSSVNLKQVHCNTVIFKGDVMLQVGHKQKGTSSITRPALGTQPN